MNSGPTAYLVIIDGQGETEDDFAVLRFWDTTPAGALQQAISPGVGYGRRDGGTAYVVPESRVISFVLNDTTTRTAKRAKPVRS